MTLRRVGGRAPKWDRLHEQEMREAKEVVERIAGRELASMELVPLWEVLARWASHRYKVCRNNAWQDKKRAAGGLSAYPASLLPPAPVSQTMAAPAVDEGEKLPWD